MYISNEEGVHWMEFAESRRDDNETLSQLQPRSLLKRSRSMEEKINAYKKGSLREKQRTRSFPTKAQNFLLKKHTKVKSHLTTPTMVEKAIS